MKKKNNNVHMQQAPLLHSHRQAQVRVSSEISTPQSQPHLHLQHQHQLQQSTPNALTQSVALASKPGPYQTGISNDLSVSTTTESSRNPPTDVFVLPPVGPEVYMSWSVCQLRDVLWPLKLYLVFAMVLGRQCATAPTISGLEWHPGPGPGHDVLGFQPSPEWPFSPWSRILPAMILTLTGLISAVVWLSDSYD